MQANKIDLKITYDKEADAAYIYLAEIEPGAIAETVPCEELPEKINGDINLDFDNHGVLRGIELLGASKVLPLTLLKKLGLRSSGDSREL